MESPVSKTPTPQKVDDNLELTLKMTVAEVNFLLAALDNSNLEHNLVKAAIANIHQQGTTQIAAKQEIDAVNKEPPTNTADE